MTIEQMIENERFLDEQQNEYTDAVGIMKIMKILW